MNKKKNVKFPQLKMLHIKNNEHMENFQKYEINNNLHDFFFETTAKKLLTRTFMTT